MVTPLLSVIHGGSDGDGLAEWLLCSDEVLFATSCCASQAEALCWATDPGLVSAFGNSPTSGQQSTLSVGRSSSGWLAAMTRTSRPWLELDSAGVTADVELLRHPAVGACLLHWFPYRALASRWFAGAAGRLLDKVSPSGATSGPGPIHRDARSLRTFAQELSPQSVAGTSSTTANTSSFGAFPVPARHARAVRPGGSTTSRRFQALHGSVASSYCPSGAQRSRPSSAALGVFQSHAGRRGTGSFLPSPVTTIVEDVEVADEGKSLRCLSKGPAKRSSIEHAARAPKRHKATVVMEGGPGNALNPAYTTPDGWAGMLSLEEIHKCSEPAVSDDGLARVAAASSASALVSYHPPEACKAQVVGPMSEASPGGSASVGLPKSAPNGPIGELADQGLMDAVCDRLWSRRQSAFVSGSPGTGKSTLLKLLRQFLTDRLPDDGQVVVLAFTSTFAKTAGGGTYHSFFGFVRDYVPELADPADEAARLVSTPRFNPINTRLRTVRAVPLDEISLVNSENMDVMHALLDQCRRPSAPACFFFGFGDILQLHPVKGRPAYMARCWVPLFGDNLLDLTVVHRQHQSDFLKAVKDACHGACTSSVLSLMQQCSVDGAAYESVRDKVLHLMPLRIDVAAHNRNCLFRLRVQDQRACYEAADGAIVDKDRDPKTPEPNLNTVSNFAVRAALADCVALATVAHGVCARIMMVKNRKKDVGLTHDSIGNIVRDTKEAVAIVRFDDHPLANGPLPRGLDIVDAGRTWIEVECPRVEFRARIHSVPDVLAVRHQVPFVLGWAMTIHMSQSLTVSEAVLDLARSFKAGMVNAALSRGSGIRHFLLHSDIFHMPLHAL